MSIGGQNKKRLAWTLYILALSVSTIPNILLQKRQALLNLQNSRKLVNETLIRRTSFHNTFR